MIYAQVINGAFVQRIDGSLNYKFDAEHYQPADTLDDADKLKFGLLPCTMVPQPAFDNNTQQCVDSGTILANGAWTQVWTVSPLSNSMLRQKGTVLANNILEATLANGFSYLGTLHHCDATFQAQVQGFVLAFQTGILASTATVPIRVMADNSVVNMTQAQLLAFAGALLTYVQGAYQANWTAKDALPTGV